MDSTTDRVHGTAFALGSRAVLIRGASGAGKSDLALRCITHAFDAELIGRAVLVADDQVLIERRGSTLLARPPETISGLLEVRGQGPMRFPFASDAELVLIADLTDPSAVERLPEHPARAEILGLALPVLRLAPFEPSAPAKLLIALARAAPLGATS